MSLSRKKLDGKSTRFKSFRGESSRNTEDNHSGVTLNLIYKYSIKGSLSSLTTALEHTNEKGLTLNNSFSKPNASSICLHLQIPQCLKCKTYFWLSGENFQY